MHCAGVFVLLASVLFVVPVTSGRRKSSHRSSEVCVDMTRTMQEGMNHFPHLQAFLLNVTIKDLQDVKFQMEAMTTATHMGTHMDAPRHFNANGITVDQIPLEKFNGVPAVVVDVRNQTLQNPGYQIDVPDLEEWERTQNSSIPDGSLVLFLTGWGERWSDKKSFLGTDQDEPEDLKFPGLSPLAATWLSQRAIVGVGTECVSVDPSGESTKTAHRTILNSPNAMYILENLASMDQLPAKGAKVRAFPMKIGGGSGAPARVVACFRRRTSSTSSPSSTPSSRSSRRSHKRHN